MPTVISKDGTAIVYDKIGNGPAIILVNGALGHRTLNGEKELAEELARGHTVIYYDRRGRGESGDKKPYSVNKEIEDIEALVDENGGKVFLYGSSSGAILAFLAAEKLGPGKIMKLALYEPPFVSNNPETSKRFNEEKKKIQELIATGKIEEAVTSFLENRGTPKDALDSMKQSPEWKEFLRVGPTLVYDFEVSGDGSIPVAIAKNIAMPTLVMNGEKSFDFMQAIASALQKQIPGAVHETLKGQTHQAAPEVLAPVLRSFFR